MVVEMPSGGCEQAAVEEQPTEVEIYDSSRNRIGHNRTGVSKVRAISSVGILFLVNLLNYMDRFTIAGVLPEVQEFYGIDNSEAGLLQTSFVCSYMILAPIFGYMGDRYNRKLIMAVGILFWSGTTLVGSFIPTDHFWLFLLCRCLVGIGEASYSTIAPTLIADLFLAEQRTTMLALFYFAIPVGSGLGYIVGSNVAHALNSWQWALRVTPPLGALCVFLVMIVMVDPPRGASEGGQNLETTSWFTDIRELAKNRSFMWSTVGFTCVAFVAGALAWWGPTFLLNSIEVQGQTGTLAQVSLIFGVITVVAGIIGVASGSFSAAKLKKKYPSADPLVCAFGLLCAMPFLFGGAVVSKYSTPSAYALIFIGETMLCLTWAIVADILLYVVIPTRRSSAEAFQILLSHALGDAGSPYIIGAVSDAIADGKTFSPLVKYHSLEYALFITCFVNVLGGLCFLITALYVVKDKAAADLAIKGVNTVGSTPRRMSEIEDSDAGHSANVLMGEDSPLMCG
ncbi:hypothetical protein CHUAL_005712 [Chamberlinius hualienensis]